MTNIFLFRKEIEDTYSQENFKRLQGHINSSPLEKGNFKFFEIEFPSAVTNFKFKHNLDFVPKDILLLYNSQNTVVTFNYLLFDRIDLDITTAGATIIRCFVGRYEE